MVSISLSSMVSECNFWPVGEACKRSIDDFAVELAVDGTVVVVVDVTSDGTNGGGDTLFKLFSWTLEASIMICQRQKAKSVGCGLWGDNVCTNRSVFCVLSRRKYERRRIGKWVLLFCQIMQIALDMEVFAGTGEENVCLRKRRRWFMRCTQVQKLVRFEALKKALLWMWEKLFVKIVRRRPKRGKVWWIQRKSLHRTLGMEKSRERERGFKVKWIT